MACKLFAQLLVEWGGEMVSTLSLFGFILPRTDMIEDPEIAGLTTDLLTSYFFLSV